MKAPPLFNFAPHRRDNKEKNFDYKKGYADGFGKEVMH